ncbi:MAG: T9SS type A sorting domain-containing protein [Lewinellaceae bacterium]|nr:T9SS type A sorting domain-containing protein [Lewinellaceae bacterium]
MTATRHSRLLQISGLLLCALVWLANNSNPPTGKTGAPFNGHCNECHDGSNPNNFDGDVTIDGLPGSIDANVTYNLTLTMNATSGSPSKGGFQAVAVDGSNVNAGDFINTSAQTGTENFASREYIEHRNGKSFSGGTVSWDFNWKAPAGGVSGNTITFYFIGNFTNGNNSDSGDFPKAFSASYQFNAPPPVTATISSSTNVSCFGGNDGSATVEADGGVPPYTYLWSNGQSTETASNLAAGTYTVTVTGSSGSGTATASVSISQPPVLNLTASQPEILSCLQTSVTSTASASGGTPGFDFSWSNGDFGATATFFDPGQYTVTATDANGCTKVTQVNVGINNTEPTAVAGGGGILDCFVTSVTLDGSGSSQGAQYSYTWTTIDGNIVTGNNTLFPVVDACGTYTLTVFNNSNGCEASASIEVTCDQNFPDVSASNTGPLTCVVLDATLNGDSQTPDVSYSWTGPNGFSSSDQNPMTNTLGTYTLVVENPVNGCTSSTTTFVSQNVVPPTDTARVSDTLTCQVDSVEISLSTNIQTASYMWMGPNGFSSNQKKDTIDAPGQYIGIVTDTINGCKTSDTIVVQQNITTPGATASSGGTLNCIVTSVQLAGGPAGQHTFSWDGPNNYMSDEQNPMVSNPGTYTITVMSEGNGCTSTASTMVQQNITPPTVSIASADNLNCNNNTVQLNASASSQGANFTYLWTTPDGIIESGETTLTPIISAPGTYNLLITNTSNSCTSTGSTTVSQSPAVTSDIILVTNVTCNGGSNGEALAEADGGNGIFTYEWSNGGTTAQITNLTAGTYTVTATDGENCTSTSSVSISEPAALLANATATGETALGANDGTANSAPSGGTAPYSFNWSNGETTAIITGLTPGTYTVTVTDENNCTIIKSVTVNSFGCDIDGTAIGTNISCNGAGDGSATVSLTGAADPVSYMWSNGETTEMISGLSPGTYTVSITDGNNCPLELSVTITQPAVVAPHASATGETGSGANNGTASSAPTGGTSPYTFLWSNDETTAMITGLTPGSYTVTVTDANNCTGTQSVVVSAFNCNLVASLTSADVSCSGGNDGAATAAIAGGQLPYVYIWSNGATTASITGLAAGTYTVTATDAVNCVVSQSITVSSPDPLVATVINIQNVQCLNDQNGSAEVVVTGGTAPYSLNSTLDNLGVGNYSVTATDANGCTTIVSFDIVATDNTPPVVSCPATIFLCGADVVHYPTPTVTDNCSAPGAPMLISGQLSGTAFDDGTTVQVFQATDAVGNTATCSFAVTVYPVPDIIIDGGSDDHNGEGVGSILITPTGGGGNFTFTWNKNGQFFSNMEDLTGLNAGTYTLTITDANGCTSALSPIVVNNTVATFEPGRSGSVVLYPNPVAESFRLKIIDLDVVAAAIFDSRGRIVYTLSPEEWQSEVKLNNISGGLYFLRLATAGGSIRFLKFMKS